MRIKFSDKGLIIALAIFLSSCSNSNIRVTNDIGEKYIIPKATIKVKNWTHQDATQALSDSTKWGKEWKQFLRQGTIKIHAKIITFRPIYVDLNNKKRALPERIVSCFNYRRAAKLKWEKRGFSMNTYTIYKAALSESNSKIYKLAPMYNRDESAQIARKKKPIYDHDIINQKICKRFGMY